MILYISYTAYNVEEATEITNFPLSSGSEEGETAVKVAKTDNPTDHLVGAKVNLSAMNFSVLIFCISG